MSNASSPKTIHRAGTPFQFKSAPQEVLQVSYTWNGVESTVGAYLEKTITTNFLVVKNDAIAAEHYFLGNDAQSKATSMSVAKSFTSALIGDRHRRGTHQGRQRSC